MPITIYFIEYLSIFLQMWTIFNQSTKTETENINVQYFKYIQTLEILFLQLAAIG